MVNAPYCPQRGDIVWMNLFPQTGREIMKRRPVLVLSDLSYNERARLSVVCPLSSRPPKHLFEIPITLQGKQGSVVVDQIKSLDWQQRDARWIASADHTTLMNVQECLKAFLFEAA